jgi:hypothetical protein
MWSLKYCRRKVYLKKISGKTLTDRNKHQPTAPKFPNHLDKKQDAKPCLYVEKITTDEDNTCSFPRMKKRAASPTYEGRKEDLHMMNKVTIEQEELHLMMNMAG